MARRRRRHKRSNQILFCASDCKYERGRLRLVATGHLGTNVSSRQLRLLGGALLMSARTATPMQNFATCTGLMSPTLPTGWVNSNHGNESITSLA